MQKRLRCFSRLNRQFLKDKGTERGRQRLDSLVIESGGGSSAIHNQRRDVLAEDIDLKEKGTWVGLIAKEQIQNACQLGRGEIPPAVGHRDRKSGRESV